MLKTASIVSDASRSDEVGMDDIVEVLFEERAQIEGKAVMTGHTKEYMKIALETEKNISNCIVKVRIENHSQIIR